MPWAVIIPALVSGGVAIGTSVYQHNQQNKLANQQRARELATGQIADDANQRAFTLAQGDLDYTRWLQAETGRARQPYLDLAMNIGGGSDYNPGPYTPAAPFVAPTREEATTEPGYQMTYDEGERLAEGSITGQGLSGASLASLQGRGRAAATGQYDKVYDRARNAYAMREALRGQAWDRTTNAGFQAAGLGNQAASARLGGALSLAQLAGAGPYPDYPAGWSSANVVPLSPGEPRVPGQPYLPPGYRVS